MAKSKRIGRRKGSRNRGHFFRKGRGWFVKEGAKFIPLLDDAGERLRAEDTPLDDVKAAYSRYVLATGTNLVPAKSGSDATVWEVCQAYLDKAKEAKGENKTFRDRAEILFDFCFGLPKRFCSPDWQPKGKPTKADKIHDGYSRRMASELKKLDLDQWLQKHPSWDGGKRATRSRQWFERSTTAWNAGCSKRIPCEAKRQTERVFGFILRETSSGIDHAFQLGSSGQFALFGRHAARDLCEWLTRRQIMLQHDEQLIELHRNLNDRGQDH